MDARDCLTNIDNTSNPYDLVLSEITYCQGTFSPSLQPGGANPTTVASGTQGTMVVDISNDSFLRGADATLVWLTGPPGDQATITMSFQNVIDGSNIATIAVTGSTTAMMAYGVSYLYASAGDAAGTVPLSRDYAVGSGSPLRVNYFIVRNTFVDTPASFLPDINKVVLLMLENRSLDHLLGQLYTESNPAQTYYPSTDPVVPYDGLGDGLKYGNSLSNGELTQNVFPIAMKDDPTTPDPDPGEELKYVNDQLWFSTPPGSPPLMNGFLQDYYENAGLLNTGVSVADSAQIMGFYTSAALPVISGLARQYAVSDAWFCSVPSQTYSNRAFSIAGTSSGTVEWHAPRLLVHRARLVRQRRQPGHQWQRLPSDGQLAPGRGHVEPDLQGAGEVSGLEQHALHRDVRRARRHLRSRQSLPAHLGAGRPDVPVGRAELRFHHDRREGADPADLPADSERHGLPLPHRHGLRPHLLDPDDPRLEGNRRERRRDGQTRWRGARFFGGADSSGSGRVGGQPVHDQHHAASGERCHSRRPRAAASQQPATAVHLWSGPQPLRWHEGGRGAPPDVERAERDHDPRRAEGLREEGQGSPEEEGYEHPISPPGARRGP